MKDIDYVELYAKKIREDNSLFQHQKRFIEAQAKGSSSLFKNAFSGNFKDNARKYLKNIGLIS